MNRNIPIGNKICATKEVFQNQVILNQHLLTMRPQINISAPKQYDFLRSKKIKEAIKQQKQQEIDRENQNLISKLTNIMQQTSNNSISSLIIKKSNSLNFVPKKSLNKDHRKKELIKIVMENQQLLKRIQDQKSQYNVKDWNEERRWVEKHIANISEYPYKDFKPTKTLVQYWTNSRINESQQQKRENNINKRLDPLIESKSQQTKQRIIYDNTTESRQPQFHQDFQQRSLFESDFQPYEPYQDKVAKIVNELIEKPQHNQEYQNEDQDQINKQQSIQKQNEVIQSENIEFKQQIINEEQNKQQDQIKQEPLNQNETQYIQQNSHRKAVDDINEQENQNLNHNQIHQNNQEIQTIDFEQKMDDNQDQQNQEEVLE